MHDSDEFCEWVFLLKQESGRVCIIKEKFCLSRQIHMDQSMEETRVRNRQLPRLSPKLVSYNLRTAYCIFL